MSKESHGLEIRYPSLLAVILNYLNSKTFS